MGESAGDLCRLNLDDLAGRIAGKIIPGMLRLPDDLRAALAGMPPAGYATARIPLYTKTAPYHYLDAVTYPGRVEIFIRDPVGDVEWLGVLT